MLGYQFSLLFHVKLNLKSVLLHLVNIVIIYGLFLNLNLSLPKMKLSQPGLKCDNDDDSDNLPDELIRITEEPKEKWDCESILSECFHCSTGSISGVIRRKVQFFFKVIVCSNFFSLEEFTDSKKLTFYSFCWLFNTTPWSWVELKD